MAAPSRPPPARPNRPTRVPPAPAPPPTDGGACPPPPSPGPPAARRGALPPAQDRAPSRPRGNGHDSDRRERDGPAPAVKALPRHAGAVIAAPPARGWTQPT